MTSPVSFCLIEVYSGRKRQSLLKRRTPTEAEVPAVETVVEVSPYLPVHLTGVKDTQKWCIPKSECQNGKREE